jgi:diacylglycerol kinase family enzyme
MRVTVMYNPEAGNARPTWRQIHRALRAAGHHYRLFSTKEDGWKRGLDEPADLVLAAGGDGTVAKVAKALAGRGVPLAIVPVGTANNIARSLELEGSPDALIERWPSARAVPFDLGVAEGPWGRDKFVESVGLGIFAHLIARAKKADERRFSSSLGDRAVMRLARARLLDTLFGYRPRRWKVALDDDEQEVEGVWLSVMNIRSLGPRLTVAPNARSGDGWLDVVIISADEAGGLADALLSGAPGASEAMSLGARRARRVRLSGDLDEAYIDDEPWRRGSRARKPIVEVSVLPGAVEVLV